MTGDDDVTWWRHDDVTRTVHCAATRSRWLSLSIHVRSTHERRQGRSRWLQGRVASLAARHRPRQRPKTEVGRLAARDRKSLCSIASRHRLTTGWNDARQYNSKPFHIPSSLPSPQPILKEHVYTSLMRSRHWNSAARSVRSLPTACTHRPRAAARHRPRQRQPAVGLQMHALPTKLSFLVFKTILRKIIKTLYIQCESEKNPPPTEDLWQYFQTTGNFSTKFYTPITHSHLR